MGGCHQNNRDQNRLGSLELAHITPDSHVLIAQRRSLWISVSWAFAAWLAATLALGPVRWTVHLAAVPLGSILALTVALGGSVVCNAVIYATRRHQSLA